MIVLIAAGLMLTAVDTGPAAASVRRVPVTKETAATLPIPFRVTAREESQLILFTVATPTANQGDEGQPRAVELWVLRDGEAVLIAPLEARTAEDGSRQVEIRCTREAAGAIRIAWHYPLSTTVPESETIYEVHVATFTRPATTAFARRSELLDQMMEVMNELNAVLEGVKDEATAQAAAPKVRALNERARVIQRDTEAMGEPKDAEDRRLEEQAWQRAQHHLLKFSQHLIRIDDTPGAMKHLQDPLATFGAAAPKSAEK